MMKPNSKRDAIIVSSCAVAGAAGALLIAAPASAVGIAAAVTLGGIAGGIILPVAGVVGFFCTKALKDFALNDGIKIAVFGLMMAAGAAQMLLVTPVKAVKNWVQKLFAKKDKPAEPKAAEAASPLTGKTSAPSFNTEAPKPSATPIYDKTIEHIPRI